jgi:hypothetical protein
MSPETNQPTNDHSDTYVKQLEALISEMNAGMTAVASNSLDTLKESIAKQEFLCANLAASGFADSRLKQLSQSPVPVSESAVEVTIIEASNTIRQLNLQYAALLKHSGRTINLLSALCSSHTGTSNQIHIAESKQQTWSCEI